MAKFSVLRGIVSTLLFVIAVARCSSSTPPQPDAGGSVGDSQDTGAGGIGGATKGTGGPLAGSIASLLPRVTDPQVSVADGTELASANAAFAFDVYRQLILEDTNLVFSPASISIVLAMTYAGAASTTASEMAQALHFTLPPARLHPAFNLLDQALASRGQGYQGADGGPMHLNIVNGTWAEQTYTFRADYLDTLAQNYGAGVNLLDFVNAPDPSRLTINAWVAAQTENTIMDLLGPGTITSLTRLVLTNAVYFNAAWWYPFDSGATQDASFTLLGGSQVTASFMSTTLILPTTQGINFVAVSLPYQDDRLSLLLVVPDAGSFSDVESSMDAAALANLAVGMSSPLVHLSLPRFRVETGTKLVDVLETLGMRSAFVPGEADFSGADGSHDLYLSEFIHKAYIDVAEKGTEGGASTGVAMGWGSSSPPPPLEIRADRPFLYFLCDQPTGAIVFMGRVLDPTQN